MICVFIVVVNGLKATFVPCTGLKEFKSGH